MRLSFDSIDEVREFVKGLKGTRGGKGSDTDEGPATGSQQAPAPIMPPQGQAGGFPGAAGFAPPGPGAGQAGGGFPAAAATGPAPEVLALVQRISTKIDGAVASGQPAEGVLNWFRTQCGPEAASATMDQIKQIALPRMPVAALENIAKLMNA
jgi:hypothetical protein